MDISRMQMFERARHGIGYLPQEPSLFGNLTVEGNLLMVLEAIEHRSWRRRRLLNQLLTDFDIVDIRKTPAASLSGGQRRRCEIARSLASNPKFLLLDEPLTGLDPIVVSEVRALVRFLVRRDLGVLITDHNVRETLSLIDRTYIIESGRLLAHGSAEHVISNAQVRQIYLGSGFRS
jgi:lipopolysaccharide export system ATP-binding protein